MEQANLGLLRIFLSDCEACEDLPQGTDPSFSSPVSEPTSEWFFLASKIIYSGFLSFYLHRILLKPQQMPYRFPVITDSLSPDAHMCADRKGVTVCSEDDRHMPW